MSVMYHIGRQPSFSDTFALNFTEIIRTDHFPSRNIRPFTAVKHTCSCIEKLRRMRMLEICLELHINMHNLRVDTCTRCGPIFLFLS